MLTGLGVWCLTPLSPILSYTVLLVGETRVHGENHRPATSHWQTLSHNVVLGTPRLSRVQTHECFYIVHSTIEAEHKNWKIACF
jgi:hypothetical protein